MHTLSWREGDVSQGNRVYITVRFGWYTMQIELVHSIFKPMWSACGYDNKFFLCFLIMNF